MGLETVAQILFRKSSLFVAPFSCGRQIIDVNKVGSSGESPKTFLLKARIRTASNPQPRGEKTCSVFPDPRPERRVTQ
jgi:hypothetical protein